MGIESMPTMCPGLNSSCFLIAKKRGHGHRTSTLCSQLFVGSVPRPVLVYGQKCPGIPTPVPTKTSVPTMSPGYDRQKINPAVTCDQVYAHDITVTTLFPDFLCPACPHHFPVPRPVPSALSPRLCPGAAARPVS